MAGEEDCEEYEYYMRNKVHLLGTLTINFHGDPEPVECLCTRVLLNTKKTRRSQAEIRDVRPLVDHLEFPPPPDPTLLTNNDIGSNVNEITAESAIDHSDENHLITSDSDENTTCCSLLKMVRSLRKRMRRRRNKKTPVEETVQVETPTTTIEPDSDSDKENVAVQLEPENEQRETVENGIHHLGYAFEKLSVSTISQIHWDYDNKRINRWNAGINLFAAKKAETSAPIDWWDADPDTYRTYVPTNENVDTEDVSTNQPQPASRRQRKKKKKSQKKPALEPTPSSDPAPALDPTPSSDPAPALDPTPSSDPAPATDIIPGTDPVRYDTTWEYKGRPFYEWRTTMPRQIAAEPKLHSFWKRRFQLFSKFNKGIQLDQESWYSVTPEVLSEHIADRCCCDVIIDGFCGAGGNTIQFAFTCAKVIAIDIDPKKIEMAKHNAAIYGVRDRIEFIVGDFFELIRDMKADVVFLSPPWGGVDYKRLSSFPLEGIGPMQDVQKDRKTRRKPVGGKEIFDAARTVTSDIAYYLPRNINTADLMEICRPDRKYELEQGVITGYTTAVTAYFGSLAMKKIDPKSSFRRNRI